MDLGKLSLTATTAHTKGGKVYPTHRYRNLDHEQIDTTDTNINPLRPRTTPAAGDQLHTFHSTIQQQTKHNTAAHLLSQRPTYTRDVWQALQPHQLNRLQEVFDPHFQLTINLRRPRILKTLQDKEFRSALHSDFAEGHKQHQADFQRAIEQTLGIHSPEYPVVYAAGGIEHSHGQAAMYGPDFLELHPSILEHSVYTPQDSVNYVDLFDPHGYQKDPRATYLEEAITNPQEMKKYLALQAAMWSATVHQRQILLHHYQNQLGYKQDDAHKATSSQIKAQIGAHQIPDSVIDNLVNWHQQFPHLAPSTGEFQIFTTVMPQHIKQININTHAGNTHIEEIKQLADQHNIPIRYFSHNDKSQF